MFSPSARRILLPLVFVGLYCLLSPAVAGTVYLKNGRVIRGPIMEKDEAGVVVGIDGGKMRIYKRFITAVVLTRPTLEGKKKQRLAGSLPPGQLRPLRTPPPRGCQRIRANCLTG